MHNRKNHGSKSDVLLPVLSLRAVNITTAIGATECYSKYKLLANSLSWCCGGASVFLLMSSNSI